MVGIKDSSKVYYLHCEDPWFTFLKNKIKKVEGRKGAPKYRILKVGDRIIFNNGENTFKTLVTQIDHYKSLDEYLTNVGISTALPGVTSLEVAKKIYHQWSSKQEIEQYGFLGIWLEVLE